MIFADYIALVLADCQQKRSAGKLPLELIEPSPARLRDLSLSVYNERPERKDERALEKFFGKAADPQSRLKSIERCEIDKLRPLVNYLKDPTIKTDPKNIELLAWLIDYRGRPHDRIPISGPVPRSAIPPGIDSPPGASPPPGAEASPGEVLPIPVTVTTNRRNGRLVIIVTVTIALASILLYRLLPQPARTFPPVPPGTQACMFWSDDHYQPIPCNEKLGDTVVIALDSERLQLRKITRPDTITEAAIGHVWYVRYRGNYEFYTGGGYHPLDPNLRLRPITHYIIGRHVPAPQ